MDQIHFWVLLQLIVDLLLVLLMLYFVRTVKTSVAREAARGAFDRAAGNIEPLLRQAEEAADRFDALLEEKRRIVRDLNEALDRRVVGLNLILERTRAMEAGAERETAGRVHDQVADMFELADRGSAPEEIAQKTGLPKGEVRLALDLRSKLKQYQKKSGPPDA